MNQEQKELLQLLDDCIDQEKLGKELLIKFVMPKLEGFVKDTSNPYDDALLVALKEFFKL